MTKGDQLIAESLGYGYRRNLDEILQSFHSTPHCSLPLGGDGERTIGSTAFQGTQ
jgi:hypothetical protein